VEKVENWVEKCCYGKSETLNDLIVESVVEQECEEALVLNDQTNK
jgi:hypothetical protein